MRNGVVFLVSVFMSSISQASATLDQFAFGASLSLEGNTLYEFEVPEYIYQQSRQSYLRDVRVFDAKGNVMVQSITESKHKTHSTNRRSQILTFFPVSALSMPDAPDSVGELNMRIQRDASGVIIDIKSDPNAPKAKRPVYYLIDLGEKVDKNLSYLNLFWSRQGQVTSTVLVESSIDLQNWKQAGKGVIFSLNNGQQSFHKNRVDVAHVRRYLKISLQPESSPVLTGLHAMFEDKIQQETPLRWTRATLLSKESNRFEYNVPVGYPFSAYRVIPSTDNALQHITVSHSKDRNKWQRHFKGNIYRLNVGGVQYDRDSVSYPVKNPSPYWRVDILSSNQKNNAAPNLEIAWLPHKLRFLTNEPGLYTVGFGSKLVYQSAPSIPGVINSDNANSDNATVLSITLPEEVFEISGKSALKPAPDGSLIKKSILWAVMCLVLVVMGYMTYRLTKSMKNSDS